MAEFPPEWGETQAGGDDDWWDETKLHPVPKTSVETLHLKNSLAAACPGAKITQVCRQRQRQRPHTPQWPDQTTKG